MKKIILLVLLAACSGPSSDKTITPPPPTPSPYANDIIGMWEKNEKLVRITLTIKPEGKCIYTSKWINPLFDQHKDPMVINYDYYLNGDKFGYYKEIYKIEKIDKKEMILKISGLTTTEKEMREYYEKNRPSDSSIGTFEEYKKTVFSKIGQIEKWKRLM